MEIINVIEISKGIIDSVESFVIMDNTEFQQEIVIAAETMFGDKIREQRPDDIEIEEMIEDALETGYWESSNGYEVTIIWSNIHI